MNNRTKVVAALSSIGMAAFVVSAFVFLVEAPVPSCNSVGAAHSHAVAVPMGSRAPDAAAPTFYSEMTKVNARMHEGMEIAPNGDIDRDFMRMMIPHHQGAIDMAVAELRYGKNEQLRRIAQEIIVEQQQEIAAMRLARGEPLPPSAPVPTNPESAHEHMEH